jgi:uncharacterized repeat protein (TIGR04042 family)
MPAVYFTIELPDGARRQCYSPSSVVRKYFQKGEEMPMADFLVRSREALAEASERVRIKFGFSCSAVASELAEIEHAARAYPAGGAVRILSIE